MQCVRMQQSTKIVNRCKSAKASRRKVSEKGHNHWATIIVFKIKLIVLKLDLQKKEKKKKKKGPQNKKGIHQIQQKIFSK